MTGTQTATLDEATADTEAVPEAISRAFDSACDVRLKPTHFKPDTKEQVIAAIMTLGRELTWSAFVAIPESMALQIAKVFAGFEVEFDSEDMDDTIKEVVNLCCVRLKTVLATEHRIDVAVSRPRTYRTASMQTFIDEAQPADVHAFRCPMGDLSCGVIVAD